MPGMPGSQVGPVPIICMYGVTMDGNSVAAYVHGFSPYFYIPAGQGFQPDDCAAFRVNNLFEGIIWRPQFLYLLYKQLFSRPVSSLQLFLLKA